MHLARPHDDMHATAEHTNMLHGIPVDDGQIRTPMLSAI